jgi:hypothetical protein
VLSKRTSNRSNLSSARVESSMGCRSDTSFSLFSSPALTPSECHVSTACASGCA